MLGHRPTLRLSPSKLLITGNNHVFSVDELLAGDSVSTTEHSLVGRIVQPRLSSLTRQPLPVAFPLRLNGLRVQSPRDMTETPSELAPLHPQ